MIKKSASDSEHLLSCTAPYKESSVLWAQLLWEQTAHSRAPSLSDGDKEGRWWERHDRVEEKVQYRQVLVRLQLGKTRRREAAHQTITSLWALGTHHQRNGDASTRLSSFGCISGSQCTVGRSPTVTFGLCRRRRSQQQALFTHCSIMKSPVYSFNPPLPESYNKSGYIELFRLTSDVLHNFHQDGQKNGHFRAPDLAVLLKHCPSVWTDIGLCLVGAMLLTLFRVTLGNAFMNVSLFTPFYFANRVLWSLLITKHSITATIQL